MAYEYQVGYYGRIKSLAGIESNGWRGLRVMMNDEVVAAATPRIILPANPRRVWAVFQQATDDATGGIYFGNTGGGLILMPQYSTVQIDINLPYSGSVIGGAGAAGCTYKVIECEIL